MSDEMRVVFNTFDMDRNGFLDRNELANAFNNFKGGLMVEEIDQLIADADTNGDGKVNFEEFVALLNKIAK